MNMKFWILHCLFIFACLGVFGQTTGKLSVEFKSATAGGNYSPRNIVAVWIEDSNGEFVKTLLAYADRRITHLNNWELSTDKKGVKYDRTDAITGATRTSHDTRKCTWDGTNYNKTLVADGNYSLCMELTDKNSTGNYSKFSFKKGETNKVEPADAPSFLNISILWEATATANIPDIPFNDDVSVIPNPMKNIFRVEGENIDKIEVWTISGEWLITNTNSLEVDMGKYKNGIYLVKVYSGTRLIVKKIVKN
jgi:hypothetical protein